MKRLLDQWERKNSKVKGQQTVDDWEREIADDEVMRDASPPPAPPSQPVVSDDSVELPAPLSGQVEALETVGICMLVEYMLAPPGAEEPQQLRAFWPDASAAEPVPAQNTEVLHDFMFRLFATCMYTPECSVLAFMLRAVHEFKLLLCDSLLDLRTGTF